MNDKLAASASSEKINFVSFNQDHDCFACATDEGFRIYNTCPYDSTFSRSLGTRIRIVEMLFRSNIVAIVGADTGTSFPPTKVFIWDDHDTKCIGEISFKREVKGVRLRRDVIVVVLEDVVYLYRFCDFQLLNKLPTFSNPAGLCAISADENLVIAAPGEAAGNIQIINTEQNTRMEKRAHVTALAAITLSRDGKLCATASEKGTLVRVFATADGSLLQELRRGSGRSAIFSIGFDSKGNWLACASNQKTVHVFALAGNGPASAPMESSGTEERKADAKNPTSVFKFMEGIIPYFKSERSFAKFRLSGEPGVVGFGPEGSNSLIGIFPQV